MQAATVHLLGNAVESTNIARQQARPRSPGLTLPHAFLEQRQARSAIALHTPPLDLPELSPRMVLLGRDCPRFSTRGGTRRGLCENRRNCVPDLTQHPGERARGSLGAAFPPRPHRGSLRELRPALPAFPTDRRPSHSPVENRPETKAKQPRSNRHPSHRLRSVTTPLPHPCRGPATSRTCPYGLHDHSAIHTPHPQPATP